MACKVCLNPLKYQMRWDFRGKGNSRPWLGCEEEPQCTFALPQLPVVDASESLQAAGMLLHCRSQLDVQSSTKVAAGGPGGGQKSRVCVCLWLRTPQQGFLAWAHLCGVILAVHQSAPLWGLWLQPRGSTHHQAVDGPLASLTSSVKLCWRSFFATEVGTKMGIRAAEHFDNIVMRTIRHLREMDKLLYHRLQNLISLPAVPFCALRAVSGPYSSPLPKSCA